MLLVQEAEGSLADVTSELKAKNALLKEREEQLANKDAELAALDAARQSQQKLQRTGSVASTSHRSVQSCCDEPHFHHHALHALYIMKSCT